MPPKAAPKEKVVKGDEAEDMVLQYLKSVNRPYASTDVSANLKNKVPKVAAQKVMLALAEKGTLTKKEYGKQVIFVYNQALLPVMSPKELSGIEGKLKEVMGELEEQRAQVKELQSQLSAKEAMPKTKDIGNEIERVKAENEATTKTLLPFREASKGKAAEPPVTAEETKKIDTEWIKWRKEWVERRKVYKDFVGQFSEGGMIQDLRIFEEDQGIQGDDDEAKEVENGEFSKPPPIKARQVQRVAAPKRVNSDSSEDTGKKRARK